MRVAIATVTVMRALLDTMGISLLEQTAVVLVCYVYLLGGLHFLIHDVTSYGLHLLIHDVPFIWFAFIDL